MADHPYLIDIAAALGKLPLALGRREDALFWLCKRIEALSGLPWFDVFSVATTAHTGGTFSPNPDLGNGEYYGGYKPDLLHVPSRFVELDRDGVTATIWRELTAQYADVLVDVGLRSDAGATLPGQHESLDSPVVTCGPITLGGLVSAAELAKRLGLSDDTVDAFLRRYRKDHWDCYIEVPADYRSTRQPRILYYPAKVIPVLRRQYKLTDE
jgi:hypothetical protein